MAAHWSPQSLSATADSLRGLRLRASLRDCGLGLRSFSECGLGLRFLMEFRLDFFSLWRRELRIQEERGRPEDSALYRIGIKCDSLL